jgi:hypothetical protein
MALALFPSGHVVVGSLPVPVGSQTPLKGCLVLLDATGKILVSSLLVS